MRYQSDRNFQICDFLIWQSASPYNSLLDLWAQLRQYSTSEVHLLSKAQQLHFHSVSWVSFYHSYLIHSSPVQFAYDELTNFTWNIFLNGHEISAVVFYYRESSIMLKLRAVWVLLICRSWNVCSKHFPGSHNLKTLVAHHIQQSQDIFLWFHWSHGIQLFMENLSKHSSLPQSFNWDHLFLIPQLETIEFDMFPHYNFMKQ